MSGVRVLVGTRKGAFVLTSDQIFSASSQDDASSHRRFFVIIFSCHTPLSMSCHLTYIIDSALSLRIACVIDRASKEEFTPFFCQSLLMLLKAGDFLHMSLSVAV